MRTEIRPVVEAQANLGECPVWDDVRQCLYWVDIDGQTIHRYSEQAGDEVIATLDVRIGAVAPRVSGGLVIAAGHGFATVDEDGAVRWLGTVGTGDRMNDGACDPAGRFLAGTMNYDRSPGAALYRLDPDGTITTLLTGPALSNGLGWSPDGQRFYYIDTPTRRVDVFDYDLGTGTPENRRTFVAVEDTPGNPDGLTVDAEGGVWVVMCRGRSVRRFTEDGKLDVVLDVPASRSTNCAFGGPDLGVLYVTTGRFDMTDEQLRAEPSAGALFAGRPGHTGLPSARYAG